MAENVQWIKLKVGMFDGNSFKKIKRANIGGVPYRDKLTAIWFELLDLAGKSNANGYLIDNNEIPYHSFEDIAIMLDRDEEEIKLCMNFYINEKMVEIIDDVYCLSNFAKYQNQEGLQKIREQKRIAQAKWRERTKLGLIGLENNECVDKKTSTQTSTSNLPSNSISNSISNSNNKDNNEELLKEYNFDSKVEETIKLWLQYKKEKKQSYKLTGLKCLLNKLKNDVEKNGNEYVINNINNSIANNWAGIFESKKQNNNQTKKVNQCDEAYLKMLDSLVED